MGFFGGVWGLIVLIVSGLVFGLIAKAILPGKQGIPLWLTILAGIVGAFIGNLVAGWVGYTNANGGLPWFRWVLDIVGSIVVVAIASALYPKRSHNGAGRRGAAMGH
ncbi:putative membrane protein YeaQ/YmgE (transglycosylase-associated protein family) [Amycolatopsis bartoniae]|uniref:Signal peptidase n=1 Tax=Amycolatopsis bartoniae TaxID=941986 RepID=A0A8H9J406_9PSEU|nr:GlsB/YeaQ/YmgE family stress response membrane protein [Amycolatopsis bartoniae]MBB2935089.1 putative membrane protein YeaQ/YmgE (transglycosylase-associated protein family) [Amycolatopsis bartoniae]TVT02563.1 GlsB/YeaQ/YmgE family stress response membrane protein [Amycolatopsis bartoniae]GHF74271.1 signal peptidase [Amycolatopsis bartoniae]